MGDEVFMGALGGAGMGAQLGSVVGPWGTAAGAVIGAVAGGIGSANKVQAQEEALERLEGIPLYDPMQIAFRDQLLAEKRSIESGFTTDFQVAKDLNKEALAGGLSVAESVGESNPALAFSLSRQAGREFNTGINQALGTISTRSLGLTQSIGEQINRISQRALDLDVLKTSQQLGIATDALQTNQTNAAQFAATLPQYAGEIGDGFQQIGGAVGKVGSQAWGGINRAWGDLNRTLSMSRVGSDPFWTSGGMTSSGSPYIPPRGTPDFSYYLANGLRYM